ncbi:hypothetical protein BT96DRAFT_976755 [Gymnopus androsaceus JB14]|uniref:F-box domain-containing protein n=1 Tax=Gymnopus androsaceus JB14 TaxID=1447944 RepID=A0A6A4HIS6_9AGAR|nr:hypothetical protein BT96DRAFT_976755 [Gymnopus androsaceus JB14]
MQDTSLLCANCSSKLDHLSSNPPDNLDQSIVSQLRSGVNDPDNLAQISIFLAETPDNLAAYAKAIAEMERLLLGLKNTRDNLQRRYENARCLVSAPLRSVPLEILHEIFTFHCYENGYALKLHSRASSRWPALKLSWVCSLWRTIVHSCPILWSSLSVSTPDRLSAGQRQILLEYISHSGDHLLSFDYDYLHGSSLEDRGVTDMLLDNSMRWYRVSLKIPRNPSLARNWISKFLFRLSKPSDSQPSRAQTGRFPAMVDLQTILPWSAEELIALFFQTFSLCPRLDTFSGTQFCWSSHNADFSHLKTMSLDVFIGKSIAHMLCRIPVLQTLNIRGFMLSESDAAGDALLGGMNYNSALSELKVSSTTFDFQWEAWRFLRLPSLTNLQITAHGDKGQDPFKDVAQLSSILLHSQSELRTLRVDHLFHPMQQGIIDFMIQHCTTLVNLTITFQEARNMESFILHLKPNGDGSCLVPNLRLLKLHWHYSWRGHSQRSLCLSIAQLVESRCSVVRSATGAIEISGLQELILVVNRRSLRPGETEAQSHQMDLNFFDTYLAELQKSGLFLDIQSDSDWA